MNLFLSRKNRDQLKLYGKLQIFAIGDQGQKGNAGRPGDRSIKGSKGEKGDR